MRVAREEIFGPVLSVLTFRTPDEAIAKANNTPYGLSAGVWTDKGAKALWMAAAAAGRGGVDQHVQPVRPHQPVRGHGRVRLRPGGRPRGPGRLPRRLTADRGGAPHGPRNVSPVDGGPIVLAEAEWRSRAAAHRQRVRRFTAPHRERKQRGEAHPVLDFLFTYYSHRPARLEEWHPGPGVVLLGAEEYLERPGYSAADDGVTPRPRPRSPGSRRPPGSCAPCSPPPRAAHPG